MVSADEHTGLLIWPSATMFYFLQSYPRVANTVFILTLVAFLQAIFNPGGLERGLSISN